MGLGDWIMATADAELVEGKAVFGDGRKAHWSEVFEANPKISRIPNGAKWVFNFPGHRPYIKRIKPDKTYTFDESFRAPYGKLYLTDQEREWAAKQVQGDFILVEPHTKTALPGILHLGDNKRWDKWDELLKLDYPWLQVGTAKPMTRQVRTDGFRHAMALIERAKLVITTDGALHHAAAALGVPAIVLWGGVVSPKILGYPTHTNIWNGQKSCGTFGKVCGHCQEAMASITVDQVRRAIEAA